MLIFPIKRAQPATALRPGRIGYDISSERLLLHTIQPREVLEALLSTGVHVPDNSLVDEDYFARRNLVFDDFEDRLKTAGTWGTGIGAWPEELRTEVERGWEQILEPSNYGRFEL
ncbi:hypothetical protein ACSBOX_08875 [Arthrobacter sp. KN11-1C]|uniref:hypothetical protein n=1 Tax=Arthrobacter sp. KN11-1C TaxID=3445774 RepID=UPI003FA0E8AE